MLNTTSNLKSFTSKLDRIAKAIPKAMDKGLTRWAVLAHKDALLNLSGPGGTGIFDAHNLGGYPVPVRTGHLRRSEGYLAPGQSKSGITAHQGQAYLFNTASYASKIHAGSENFSRYGARPFASDAIKTTRAAGMLAIRSSLHAVLMR